MKFKYRGTDYHYEPELMDMVESDRVAQYRGQSYHVAQPSKLPVPQPVTGLSYRGVPYRITETGATETLSAAEQTEIKRLRRPAPSPVSSQSPLAVHSRSTLTSDSNQVHRQTVLTYLQHRIRIAQAKGDEKLLHQLEEEMQLLGQG